MKTARMFPMLALCGSLVAACGGDDDDPQGRFDGKTEAEMFTIVRDVVCDVMVKCPPDSSPDVFTKETCVQLLDDSSAFQGTIDEAAREKLDACLTAVANAATCEESEKLAEDGTGVCAEVGAYLDLK